MGVDATTKIGPERQAAPPLPPVLADSRWVAPLLAEEPAIRRIHLLPNGRMAIAQVAPGAGALAIARIQAAAPVGAGADQLWVVDSDIDPTRHGDLLWAIATRADPGRDMRLERTTGRFALDATVKTETGRVWGRVLRMEDAMVEKVSSRWAEYGLPGKGVPMP
jgi:3-polyprenyl-4-hydroxybenzoate decarboxylase